MVHHEPKQLTAPVIPPLIKSNLSSVNTVIVSFFSDNFFSDDLFCWVCFICSPQSFFYATFFIISLFKVLSTVIFEMN